MEVSTQTNSYQAMNMYQRSDNSIQPVPEPIKPDASSEDIYKASNGNLIKTEDGTLALTPQGQLNVSKAEEEKLLESQEEIQAQKDQQREYGASYIANKSMQSQVEIYLSVATDSDVDIGSDSTATILESLRDVQKQNNAVEAYATYAQNQNSDKISFY
jgi:hypothetical protein